MDGPTSPSIMGAENSKFTSGTSALERHPGMAMSDSESMDLTNLPDQMSTSMMSARKSKDGLSREERMKVVRERQQEEHKRRLDELRAAQMQAMRAKKQLDTERRRRVEEMKGREEQRRAAVEERRKRIEDAERNRREAILRKHEEIFERIEQKRRQHESRRAAYGQQANGESSPYNVHPSRRAISVGVLSGRASLTPRSYHQSHTFSPGSLQSARYQVSPSTPSRAGGDRLLESVSGSSSEISPVHTGRQGKHFRMTHSHPPPTQRKRGRDNTRERPTRPATSRTPSGMSASMHTDGSKTERAPRRPTTLPTRGRDDSDIPNKVTTSRSTDTFKIMSRRSQSASNVNRKAESPEKEMEEEGSRGRKGKVISEAEAKAALAEKRRLARLKVEAERNELGTPSSRGVDESVSPSHPADAMEATATELPRKSQRSQSIVMFEQDEARMEQGRSSQDLASTPPVESVTVVKDETAAEEIAKLGEEHRETREEAAAVEQTVEETLNDAETVVQPDVIPNQKVEARMDSPPAEEEVQDVAKVATPTVLVEEDEAERARQETERRRQEMEQREEEERTLRRQRLEAIKRLTKGAASTTTTAERIVSPQVDNKGGVGGGAGMDALENARKVLQRRGMGSGAESPVTTPGEPENGKVNGIGTHGMNVKDKLSSMELDPYGMTPSNGWAATPEAHRNNHVTQLPSTDLLVNFE